MPQPRVNGHEARRRRTRQSLRDSASALFDAHGYEATTVADIAGHARVSERTFYVHFRSKEDLLFAHVQDFAILALRVAQETDSPHAVDRVRATALALIDAACDEESVARQAKARAAIGVQGQFPRSLASELMNMARELSLRIAAETDSPRASVAPMVGAALGAVGGAGIDGALNADTIGERRDAMTRALDAALHGFRTSSGRSSGPRPR
jgi:AcrR family transcriptional regulator